jgi:hypothetical protein
MKILSKLWGLIVDDTRLVSILLIFLLISWGVTMAGQSFIAAFLIWAGLIISLFVSIKHQIQLKISKK